MAGPVCITNLLLVQSYHLAPYATHCTKPTLLVERMRAFRIVSFEFAHTHTLAHKQCIVLYTSRTRLVKRGDNYNDQQWSYLSLRLSLIALKLAHFLSQSSLLSLRYKPSCTYTVKDIVVVTKCLIVCFFRCVFVFALETVQQSCSSTFYIPDSA